jgi:hypothetical protein
MKLSEAYLASPDGKDQRDIGYVTELYESFRAGLGLEEEDEIQVEFRKDRNVSMSLGHLPLDGRETGTF